MNIAVLGSTRGSNLIPLKDELSRQKIDVNISVVVSDDPDALILDKAKKLNIESLCLSPKPKAVFENKLDSLFRERNIDLIILIGFMRILSPSFVGLWRGKILNVHPSLLPLFAKKMDLAVHEAVIQAGSKETGCTVHEVTQDLDGGPIVTQLKCEVLLSDTPQTLKERVQNLEVMALAKGIMNKRTHC